MFEKKDLTENKKPDSSTIFRCQISKEYLATSVIAHCNNIEKSNAVSRGLLKIETSENALILYSVNDFMFFKQQIPANISGSGTVIVDAIKITNIVRKLPNVNVQLTLHQNKLIISAESCTFEINTFSNFAKLLSNQGEQLLQFQINYDDLLKIMKYGNISMLQFPIRRNLHCISLQQELKFNGKNNLVAISTDGHRMTITKNEIEILDDKNTNRNIKSLLPAKLVRYLIQLNLLLKNTMITCTIYSSTIQIESNTTLIISNLVDANTPDYFQLIPKNNNITLTLNKEKLSQIINRIITVIDDKIKIICFHLTDKKLEITSAQHGDNYAQEIITNDQQKNNIKADQILKIGLNAKYILDILGAVDGENVTFKFSDNTKVGVMCFIHDDNIPKENDNMFIIMPVILDV